MDLGNDGDLTLRKKSVLPIQFMAILAGITIVFFLVLGVGFIKIDGQRQVILEKMINMSSQDQANKENIFIIEAQMAEMVQYGIITVTLMAIFMAGAWLFTFQYYKRSQRRIDESDKLSFHKSRMVALGEMAAGIAHEVNNPLMIIHSGVEVIEALLPEDKAKPHARHALRSIILNVNRISKIVQGLKSMTRDSREDKMTEAWLYNILDDAISIFRERLRINSIEFRYDPSERFVRIKCHPGQISQVILNLVSNAADVLIENMSEDPIVELYITHSSDRVLIHIRDNGIGITGAKAAQIFDPFFTTKAPGKGTGLGLSISASIIRRHGGEIRLVNEPKEKGAHFVIDLPTATMSLSRSEKLS